MDRNTLNALQVYAYLLELIELRFEACQQILICTASFKY